MYKKILVSNDGSPHARRATSVAIELAKAFGASLVVLHVRMRDATPAEIGRGIDAFAGTGVRRKLAATGLAAAPIPVGGGSENVPGAYLDILAQHVLDYTVEKANKAGISNVTKVLGNGRPHQVILETAARENVDLIVLGSRGLGMFRGIVQGSVSQRVVQQATRSCLVVRLPDERELDDE